MTKLCVRNYTAWKHFKTFKTCSNSRNVPLNKLEMKSADPTKRFAVRHVSVAVRVPVRVLCIVGSFTTGAVGPPLRSRRCVGLNKWQAEDLLEPEDTKFHDTD
jgi:hypothetical protein